MESLERELRERDDLGAGSGCRIDRRKSAPDVVRLVRRRVLLDECNLHSSILPLRSVSPGSSA
jgi:hypothetical protein